MRSSGSCHRCEHGGTADASSHLKFPTESHLNDGIALHPEVNNPTVVGVFIPVSQC